MSKKTRIAALGDLHVGKPFYSGIDYKALFSDISRNADIFVMCGDLTDHGSIKEAEQLVDFLKECSIPKLAVLGNHDFAHGEEGEITRILQEHDVHVLGEEFYFYDHIGFAGVKGFGGGYGIHTLGAFGEHVMRQFVQETINEAETLEIALDNLGEASKKVVMLHYSPVPSTNKGEPLEIYPFLGTSRLEEVIDRHEVSVVFHGHAHFGSPHGRTLKGIDVFNVAYLVMQKVSEKRPYRIYEM